MNVNLWFAKDVDNNEIISVTNIIEGKQYSCPICNSEVTPKALESTKVTPHFAHIDKHKCGGESFIHFWMKHLFIEVGESFTVKTDKSIKYFCKSFKTEVRYELESGMYIPDLVVTTECGSEIVFEMAHTNKKQVKDYIDKWIELDKVVVQVDIRGLVNNNKEFKALYYKGKCFNFNTRDGGYYNTIGKIKEKMQQNDKYNIEVVRKFDWFWEELVKYRNGEMNIDSLTVCIDEIFNNSIFKDEKSIIRKFLLSKKCSNIYSDYLRHKAKTIKDKITEGINVPDYMKEFIKIEEYIYYDKYRDSYGVYVKNEYHSKNELFYEYEIEEAKEKLKNDIKANENNSDILLYNKIQKNKELIELAIEYAEIDIELGDLVLTLNTCKSKFNLNRIVFSCKKNSIREYIELNEKIAVSEDLEEIRSFISSKFSIYKKFFLSNVEEKNMKEMLSKKFRDRDNNEYVTCSECAPNFLKIYSINSKVDVKLFVFDDDIYLDYLENDYSCNKLDHYIDRIKNSELIAKKEEYTNIIDKVEEIIRNIFDNFIKCKDCRKTFEIKTSERKFFLDRGLILPKRCKICRQKRKEGTQ